MTTVTLPVYNKSEAGSVSDDFIYWQNQISAILTDLHCIVDNIIESPRICPINLWAILGALSGNFTRNTMQISQHGGYLVLSITYFNLYLFYDKMQSRALIKTTRGPPHNAF